MEYIILAFRSRSDTVKFSEFLRNNFVPAEIVNTPKEAGVGCGLSVKFSSMYLSAVKRAVVISRPASYAGFFSVKTIGGRKFVKSI